MARRYRGGNTKGITFVYIFVGAFIGLLFTGPVGTLAQGAVNNSTGMSATIYGYIDEMYALCCFGLMVGSLYKFFKG